MLQHRQCCQFTDFDSNCWSLDDRTTGVALCSTQVFWRYRCM